MRSTPWIKLKIADVAPIPSARVSAAMRLKPGCLSSLRIANRNSCNVGLQFCL